jgi:hypothetical protein
MVRVELTVNRPLRFFADRRNGSWLVHFHTLHSAGSYGTSFSLVWPWTPVTALASLEPYRVFVLIAEPTTRQGISISIWAVDLQTQRSVRRQPERWELWPPT